MNIEQVEGQLNEFKGKHIAVAIPIRGTVHQTFYGNLEINVDWVNNIILYVIKFYPDADISFRAEDVHKIIVAPNDELSAKVILNSDTWLQQESIK